MAHNRCFAQATNPTAIEPYILTGVATRADSEEASSYGVKNRRISRIRHYLFPGIIDPRP
eukprot:scaffold758_cov104-Cylindrotheca_fusiformis.AAC.4